MLDILCKGSLKSNGVCISELREYNSSSYPILMEQEGMMQKEVRSKDPKTVGCYHAPEMAPLNLIAEKFGTLMPSSLPEKGRKRLRQASSSDEEDEHTACAASSPEY
jgi:hypothetical protein